MKKSFFYSKKRIVAGLFAGLLLVGVGFTGVQAAQTQLAEQNVATGVAAVAQNANKTTAERPPFEMNPSEAARHIHEQFGVDESEVRAALMEHRDFHDVGQAAMLAKISGKSFSDVLALKTEDNDWKDVETQLGVTREQIRNEMNEMLAQRIGQCGDVDEATALKLLNNGYCDRDIAMAGKIAKASGKDIQSVLDLKKINNRWGDVAESLGLDRSVASFHGKNVHHRGDAMMGADYDDDFCNGDNQ